MTASPDPVRQGEAVNYVMTVVNRSGVALEGVQLRNTVPAYSVDFDDTGTGATCPGGFCDPGETMTWDLGTLPAGQSRSVVYSAVISDSFDPAPDNIFINSAAEVVSDHRTGGRGASAAAAVRVGTGIFEQGPPALAIPRFVISDEFRFFLIAGVGKIYTVQASADLINWSNVTSLMSTNIATEVVRPVPASTTRQFYRVQF